MPLILLLLLLLLLRHSIPALLIGIIVFVGIAVQARKAVLVPKGIIVVAILERQRPIRDIVLAAKRTGGRKGVAPRISIVLSGIDVVIVVSLE